MTNGNDMVFVMSMDPNDKRKKPRQIPAKLVGTAAFKNHKFKVVPDPNLEPEPQKVAPIPIMSDSVAEEMAAMRAEIERLRKAQTPFDLAGNATTTADPNLPDPEPLASVPETTKRPPGRPRKTQA